MEDIRKTYTYKKWKEDVLFRDQYMCSICGATTNLEVHHIKPLAKFPELATDLNNGITLCQKCHYEQHNRAYSRQIEQTHPSLIGGLHPVFVKLREITYYLSYRTGIIKRFWKELPLPRKFKRWLEEAYASFLLLGALIIVSIIGRLIHG